MNRLERIIAKAVAPFKYYGLFDATIQSQDAEFFVDVLPDDASIMGDGLSRVPIRHGLPGVIVIVAQGARCLLGFENGKPSAPYVSLWAEGSVQEIRFGGGTKGVARVGDPVSVSLPLLSAVGTLNGSPWAASLAVGTQLPGTIMVGSQKLFGG